jgi:hypothetical protein
MPEISLAETVPLRPFHIDLRDKDGIKTLFYTLDVHMFGWNLPMLFKKYCMDVDPSLPAEHHYRKTLKLVAILIGGENNALIVDPEAIFSEDELREDMVVSFIFNFVSRLKRALCDPNSNLRFPAVVHGTTSYARRLHGAMTSVVYAEMKFAYPAVPAITAFMLILLGNMYPLTLCTMDTIDIVKSMATQINLSVSLDML